MTIINGLRFDERLKKAKSLTSRLLGMHVSLKGITGPKVHIRKCLDRGIAKG